MQVTAVGDAARRAARERQYIVCVGDIAVRVGRPFAARDANARALVDSGDRVLDLVVVEDELQRLVSFPEELCPIATARQRRAQGPLRVARGDER